MIDGKQYVVDALDSFRCCKDLDIESFLRKKALQFLDRNWCSIYLILEEEAFDAGRLAIAAYFTLSHKSLLPVNVSKKKIRDTNGFADAQAIHFILIGQLGKYISEENGAIVKHPISSKRILDFAMEVVQESNRLIPCRCVLVECSEEETVQKAYTDYGFSFFQKDEEHYQFYKKVSQRTKF